MIGLLGKKVGMSQLFDAEGQQVPVTVLEVGPCFVTALRTKEKNGYQGVQLGFDAVKEKRLNKAKLGAFKKASVPVVNFVREIRTDDIAHLSVGSELRAENFEAGEYVDIEGISIGKGFQGVVKRLNYKGGASKSHGSMFGRVPGSIGAKAGGVGCRKKVRKGKGLPGHMGDEKICIHNLKVMKVDAENNLLVLKGSVPGAEGSYLIVRSALKRGKKNAWKVRGSKQESPKEASSETSKAENPQAPLKD
ncbi:MAG TPA: 50S ribosomal protein L3 [Candidatus Omnitrophota bacterium]|nr:50S ribosomal protein L3 [Candidatus Omnitrophota bacterium]HRY86102.1 50S ribosomal protein L3 [Candidatus Omnitrophota bacterium]